MLKIESINYAISGRYLFEDASAVIPAGLKAGVVGRNGNGKTTLLRLIRGELAVESGSIALPRGIRIGGVEQHIPDSGATLLETVLSADTERDALLREAESACDPQRIAEIQLRLAEIEAWSAEARAASILKGLGFADSEWSRSCSEFSGGWRMRIALAATLFAKPDLLLLDEPNNYLDLEGSFWLADYLLHFPHTALIVSHDRDLLNRAADAILLLQDRKLSLFRGSFDRFLQTHTERMTLARATAKKQEARRAHLQSYVDRFRYKADKAKQAQSRLKALAKMQPVAISGESALQAFSFPDPEQIPPPILRIENGATGYGQTRILNRLNLRIDSHDRIALLGRNGHGKSTLAKLFANRLPLLAGTSIRHPRLRIGYFAQHLIDELRMDETPLDHLRRLLPEMPTSRLRSRLADFGLGLAQAEIQTGQLSGGQKARFALLVVTLDAPHMLVLDEPSNHLDLQSRDALVEALATYSGAVILVSHDAYLQNLVADQLWLVADGTVRPFEGDLETYRALSLRRDRPTKPAAKVQKPAAFSRNTIGTQRRKVQEYEKRVEQLNLLETSLATKLADPRLYEDGRAGELAACQEKYRNVTEALETAETSWIEALSRLEASEAQAGSA